MDDVKINELYTLWKESYCMVEPVVLDIIHSKNEDIHLIEDYLDTLLGIPTDESYELFKEFCEYYSTINEEYASFYLDTWDEMYEDVYADEVKIKKISS